MVQKKDALAAGLSTHQRKRLMGYLFLLPAVLSFIYFVWYPLIPFSD